MLRKSLVTIAMLMDVPVHKRSLGVHEVELVVELAPRLGDGGGVAEHGGGALHLRQVAARHHRRRLVVDAHLDNKLICETYDYD